MKKVAFLFLMIAGLAIGNRASAQVFIHASINAGIPLPPPPRPIYYAPAPQPVYYAPAPRPVYYAPAPAYCAPAPCWRPRYHRGYGPVVVVRERPHYWRRW